MERCRIVACLKPPMPMRGSPLDASHEDRTESRAGRVKLFITKAVDEPLGAVEESR